MKQDSANINYQGIGANQQTSTTSNGYNTSFPLPDTYLPRIGVVKSLLSGHIQE